MEDSPHLYTSEFGEDENVEEQQQEGEEEEGDDDDNDEEKIEDKESEETQCSLSLISMNADELIDSSTPCPEDRFSGNLNQSLLQDDPDLDADLESHDSFPCQHCERRFTSRQGLERHLHIHALANHQTHTFKCKYCSKSFGSKIGRRRHERRHENARTRPGSLIKPVGSIESTLRTESVSGTTGLVEEDQEDVSDEHREIQGGDHACKYCKKGFSTHINVQRHQRRIHERHLRLKGKVVSPQKTPPQKLSTSREELKPVLDTNTVAVQEHTVVEPEEQYMLDISSNISENLSFYIDGKIVSTSTVSSCEVMEVNSGSATLIGLDAVILNPTQISQALNVEVATGNEIPGQPLTKRRTATPPLLPQIKTELESESVLSSSASSSSIVSSLLIEGLLPHIDSTVLQKEKTVFLSPKLKQLLQTQDGLKPTLALITDGQALCSLTVLPAGSGRFKRRTGSPPNTPQQSPTSNVENTPADQGSSEGLIEPQMENSCSSPALDMSNNDENISSPPVEEPMATHVSVDGWPLMSGGNSCNQQPLDLSAAVMRNEDEAPGEAVLDLSFQRKGDDDDSEATGDLIPQPLVKKRKPDTSMLEKVLMNEYANLTGEQELALCGQPEEPLVTDIAIVTASDMSAATGGLVFGLALPSATLTQSPPSLTPVALQPASPCTFALASPASHTALPTAPSLLTVLTSPACSTPGPANEPTLQVLAPEISTEPFLICTDNKPFESAQCELNTVLPDWATASSANLVTISQPLDPTLSLPGHMFLADPSIALNAPIVHSAIGSELSCSPALTLNDSLINSFNITSNTVLIECTIALDGSENLLPTAITVREDTGEPLPVPAQMVISHVEQQQILSLSSDETVEPTILLSSIAESLTLSSTSTVISECPLVEDTNSTAVSEIKEEEPNQNEQTIEEPMCPSETESKTILTSHDTTVGVEEPEIDTKPQVTFTKNFVCNVCDQLYHSMKELGHHVSEHSDNWPYKCEFCVLLFADPSALLEHRSVLHGVGKIYVCSSCTKEFAYLCNLKHHQEELHPGQQCTHTEEEKGKLRPQNYNNSTKVTQQTLPPSPTLESKNGVTKDEEDVDEATEELFTSIKILASDGSKPKGPDVRLGINQNYPSYKPPPFPYHNRSPGGSMPSATTFTTHNIPQTFSTAIRCTKCGKSFDNMPELHKHILSCANASDKRRYTPKKNPIPLRHFAKPQNGVLASTNATNGQNAPHRVSLTNRQKSNQEASSKQKLNALNKRKKLLVQRAITQKSKSAASTNKVSSTRADEQLFVCPHCSREFTYRRSRTKHMAVCPMKPKELKKRKDGGAYFTKENNRYLRRGVVGSEEKTQAPEQMTRAHSSSPVKRPAVIPAHTVLVNKKCKTVAKETVQPRQEALKMAAPSNVRPVNSQHQASRVLHGVNDAPSNSTVGNSPRVLPRPKKADLPAKQAGTTSTVKQHITIRAISRDQQDPAV